MGRDRFVHVEWMGNKKGVKGVKDFGYCDHGCKLQTREEAEVYKTLKDEGWKVHKNGWPDFMATRGEETRLIEVKSNADQRRQSQVDVHVGLAKLGAEVETWVLTNAQRRTIIRDKAIQDFKKVAS